MKILSCNFPDAIRESAEGLISPRSLVSARHGVELAASVHPILGPVVTATYAPKGWTRTWPASQVQEIEWAPEEPAKPAKAK